LGRRGGLFLRGFKLRENGFWKGWKSPGKQKMDVYVQSIACERRKVSACTTRRADICVDDRS
jgi:hypothetical protein